MRRVAGMVPLAAAAFLGAFVTVIWCHPGGQPLVTAVDDLATCFTGVVASAALGLRTARCTTAARRSWALLTLGVLCASVGDLLWAYYELVLRHETPFPSLADASYLLFPVFTCLGLLLRPHGRRSRRATLRLIFDGALVAGSLFALSWTTALGAVAKEGADSPLGFAVALAYPVTDVILLTITILVITARSLRGQVALILTGAALISMTVADSAFAFLTAAGTYGSGNILDSGFVAAYLLLAMAAYHGDPASAGQPGPPPPAAAWAVAFPYLLCVVGVLASVGPLAHRADTVPLATAATLVAVLFTRQLLTIADNRRLLAEVAQRERQLHHQAFHDSLTGLANRALFADRLAHALTLPSLDGTTSAVMFLDLDDFKLVNDSLGHLAGDALLVQVAGRLRAAVGPCDTVARLGGDEFAVMLENCPSPQEIGRRVAASFAVPFDLDGVARQVRASIGMAPFDGLGPQRLASELLQQADIAMYAAKRTGPGQCAVFTPDLAHVAEDELNLRDALAQAIAEGTIDVVYQPIFHTASQRLIGVEALARWSLHGTPISPEAFLPIARRLGLIGELDQLVLRQALPQLARWRRLPGYAQITCAVNTDEVILRSPDLIGMYARGLAEYGLPAGSLMVELPESHLSSSTDLDAAVAALRACGVKVALDDFGTHGSSLARLHRVRVDTVKLDRDFLTPTASGALDSKWLASIISLAHSLDMRVIAEGVETPEHFATLTALGCDAVQGFLLGRPLPAERLILPGTAALPPSPRSHGTSVAG